MQSSAPADCATCGEPLKPRRWGTPKYCDRVCYNARPRPARRQRVRESKVTRHALAYIAENGLATTKEIALHLGVSEAQVYMALAKRVISGDVERCYGLTAQGKQIVNR